MATEQMSLRSRLRDAGTALSGMGVSLAARQLPKVERAGDSLTIAEEAGLVFAFRVRSAAIVLMAIVVVIVVQWPRSLSYLGFLTAFFLSGYVPFLLRRHPFAQAIKLAFVVVDVLLICAILLNLPVSSAWIDWPIQTRLRSNIFMFTLLLLGEAALTYSARRVLWTGSVIITIWSIAFLAIYNLPDSKGRAEMAQQSSDQQLLSVFLDATYVSQAQWLMQVVATFFLTWLLAIAVYRSRVHLLAQIDAQIRKAEFARYLSPDVAEAVSDSEADRFGQPQMREVAVLFADIVGFTRFNETLSPQRTFALLQSFRERSTGVVFRHRGTLDKYLGDGFMATFGALQSEPDAPRRAIDCAFDLLDEVERWNAKRSARGAERIQLSVGVHFGPVIVGNVGGAQRVEFTVVGDVVNVASRLETATRDLGCPLAVSDECLRAAGGVGDRRFTQVHELQLRGRNTPIIVHLAGGAG